MVVLYIILMGGMGFFFGFYLGPIGCIVAFLLSFSTTYLLLKIKDRKSGNRRD